jgi:hypothetical protein
MKGIIYVLNVLIIILILWRMKIIDNDKSIILMVFFYPALILLNLIIATILKLVNNPNYKPFIQSVLLLLILLVPILIFCRASGFM